MKRHIRRGFCAGLIILLGWVPFVSAADELQISYPKSTSTELNLLAKKSQVLKFGQTIKRTAIANAEIADILPLSLTEILVVAKSSGVTNLVVWNELDESFVYNISVKPDAETLLYLLKSVDPTAEIEVYPTDKSFAVKGKVESNVSIQKLMEVAESYAPGAVNMLKVKEPKQVLLETRVAEVDRSRAERLGIDYEVLIRNFALGFLTGGQSALAGPALGSASGFKPTSISYANFPNLTIPTTAPSSTTAGTTGFMAYSDGRFNQMIGLQALEYAQVLKLIARPNLMAKDGEEANFLVGGEFPVVVVTNNTVNIEFKEYGTKLTFKPEFQDEQIIKLTVEPEVSELDTTNSVTLSGFNIPGILTRKTKTVVNLYDGQSFVIGGLLYQTTTRIHTKIPFIGDIPFIGALTKSSGDTGKEQELIVLVTPHIVRPLNLPGGKEEVYPQPKVESTVQFIDAQSGSLQVLKLTENVRDVGEGTPRLLPWLVRTDGVQLEPPRTFKNTLRELRDTLKAPAAPSAPVSLVQASAELPSEVPPPATTSGQEAQVKTDEKTPQEAAEESYISEFLH